MTDAVSLSRPDEDIRDIRGPKTIIDSWMWPVLVAVALAAAFGGWILWRRRRIAPRQRAPSLVEQTLERLGSTKLLMQPDKAREFGIAASEVIRNYIEKRFAVVATQRTTEEFLQSLLQSSNTGLEQHRGLLDEFLHRCDFVKFAGTSLAQADLESLFESARTFVLQTSESPAAS